MKTEQNKVVQLELDVSQGPWREHAESYISPATDEYETDHRVMNGEDTVCFLTEEGGTQNGELIADVGNVYQRTGMTPSELEAELERIRKEKADLLEALDVCHRVMLYRNWNMVLAPSLEHDAWSIVDRIRRQKMGIPAIAVNRCVEAGENDPDDVCLCDGEEVCWEKGKKEPPAARELVKMVQEWIVSNPESFDDIKGLMKWAQLQDPLDNSTMGSSLLSRFKERLKS